MLLRAVVDAEAEGVADVRREEPRLPVQRDDAEGAGSEVEFGTGIGPGLPPEPFGGYVDAWATSFAILATCPRLHPVMICTFAHDMPALSKEAMLSLRSMFAGRPL